MTITVYPPAYVAALDLFNEDLADAANGIEVGLAAGVSCGEGLPSGWKLADPTPFVAAAQDGAFPELFVVEHQIVRVTVWHATRRQALALAQICRGMLLAHSGTVIRNTVPLTGPIPATDPTNDAPTAYFTVDAVVRAVVS